VIKRYPNRKLYDTEAGRYITLEDVAALICRGHEVQVVDHVTGEDLTVLTLAQVILEQARRREGGLPLSVLAGLIRAGGDLSKTVTLVHGSRPKVTGFNAREAPALVEGAIRRALARRGAPTRQEFQSLVAQVEALAAEIDEIAYDPLKGMFHSTSGR
jgi:polyhydroxyalkanoate synthesis repressor PhaR